MKFLATGSCFLDPPANTQRCPGLSSATGGGYYYQFSLDGVVVQPYGTGRIYTLPASTPNGSHTVRVDVTTSVPNADQVPAVFAELTVNVQGAQPVTGLTLTPVAPITTTYGTGVTFTAAASGGAVGAVYSYRFALDGAPFAGAWSTVNTYTTPTTALGGNHTVAVEATTAPSPQPADVGQLSTSTNYDVVYPAATGVAWAVGSPSPGSPQPIGTSVTFTAAGSSSLVLPASAYKYQFSLNSVVVQPWGPSASYTMIGNTVEANHTIQVDVTTEAVPATVQAFATTSFGLYGPATGVLFQTITPATGQTYPITPATFVAVASGGGPAVPGYQYRFLLDGAEVQGWSANASYLMGAATLGGIHTVRVEATTGVDPAGLRRDDVRHQLPAGDGGVGHDHAGDFRGVWDGGDCHGNRQLVGGAASGGIQVPVPGRRPRGAELEHLGHIPWTWHHGSGTKGDPGEREHAERAHLHPGNGADDVHHHHAAGDGVDADRCSRERDPDHGRDRRELHGAGQWRGGSVPVPLRHVHQRCRVHDPAGV